MAMDLKLLELTRVIFLQLPPNISGWSAGLDAYAQQTNTEQQPVSLFSQLQYALSKLSSSPASDID